MSADMYEISMGMNERVGSCTVDIDVNVHLLVRQKKNCDNAMQRKKMCESNQTRVL